MPQTWLGVRSPLPLISLKMTAAILGAAALTPRPHQRHYFSRKNMFGGQCTITAANYSFTMSKEPHAPPLMHDIVLTATDHGWLSMVAALFDLQDKPARSKLRSLEYFYRAWFLDPRERFPVLCMSLDSLVSAERGHTAAAIDFIKNAIATDVDENRLRLLMRIRGSVIHGAAPDVYDSENYEKYYATYEADPIADLEMIVAKCLRQAIFGAALTYHANPNAKLLAKLHAEGRISKGLDDGYIIAADI